MGFLDKVKKAFERGGVDIELEAPDTFRWSDDMLPVSVQLIGDDEEERVVTGLTFELVEDTLLDHREDESPTERARRKRRAENSGVKYNHNVEITLAPGEVKRLDIEVPLSLDGVMEQVGADGEAPAWLSKASDAMSLIKDVTRDEEWFRLKVSPDIEGFDNTKIASRRIRNLRAGEWGGRFWNVTVD